MKYQRTGTIIGDVVNISQKEVPTKNGGKFVIHTVRIKNIEEKKCVPVDVFSRVTFFGDKMRDTLNLLLGKHVKVVFQPISKPFTNKQGEQVWFDQLEGVHIDEYSEGERIAQQMSIEEEPEYDEDIPF